MPEVEAVLVDYLHGEDSRADVLVLSEVLDELYRGFLNKFLAVFSLASFLPGGDVHESSVLVAADEVHIVVVLQEGMGKLLNLFGPPHGMDVLLNRAVPHHSFHVPACPDR